VTRFPPDLEALRGDVSGDVILPGSPDYDPVRKPAIARFHQTRPRAVVSCGTPEDVSEVISFARRHSLPAAPRSGGHCFAGRSSTTGVVIDASPMRSVSVSGGVATVGAGAPLGDVYDALEKHDRTVPAGCGPTVGISGLTLGGGLGILGRSHGLTSDHLLAAQVVLADGRIVECDERRDEELFWALRGAGGGNFGVVTSLVFETVPAPAATAFHLIWPHDHAGAVMEAWQGWSPTGPDELAASLLLTASGDPACPPAINVFGAMLGTRSDTEELLEDLVVRVGAVPTSASLEHASYRQTKRYLAEHGLSDDRPNGHQFIKSEFFRRSLPVEAVTALVENFTEGRISGQSRELDFTPWGGAYNRVPTDATAFAHREELFLLLHVVVVDPEVPAAEREAARGWLGRSWASVHPWGSGDVYPNFPDPDLADPMRAYHGTNLERLVHVKRRYDPDGFFRFPQSVPDRVLGSGALARSPAANGSGTRGSTPPGMGNPPSG
jgi:FAD/FMN-containing dehydrogenase